MPDDLFLSLLREPPAALPYALTSLLRETHAERHLLESEESLFDVERFLRSHGIDGFVEASPPPQVTSYFGPPRDHELPPWGRWGRRPVAGKATDQVTIGWFAFDWEGSAYELAVVTWPGHFQPRRRRYLLAEDRAQASSLFEAVCAYNAEVRDEILVFANGCWSKSKALFRSVTQSSFTDLVLREGLAEQIRSDFERFLGAREDYVRHRIPYKRGALFLGPPGNGKTLCIKALIGALEIPCLYVQSFHAPRMSTQQNISEVFRRARRTSPCLLVLEDLDTLVDGQSLSFFLNELDGFAGNEGLVTIASTNHPEKLDPAILHRPSRFDRKYHFELPGADERTRYVERWNGDLAEDLRLPDARLHEVVGATEGYSYAYLKELFISSLMRWTAEEDTPFVEVVLSEAHVLTEQMKTAAILPETRAAYVDEMPAF